MTLIMEIMVDFIKEAGTKDIALASAVDLKLLYLRKMNVKEKLCM